MLKIIFFLFLPFLLFAEKIQIRDYSNKLFIKINYPGLNSKKIILNKIDHLNNRYLSKDGNYSLVKEDNKFIGLFKYKKNYLTIDNLNSIKLRRHITTKYNCTIKSIYKKNSAKATSIEKELEVILFYDDEYYSIYGKNSKLKILAIINAVDGIYRSQLNIKISPKVANQLSLSSTSPLGLLLELKDKTQSFSLESDLVHLFTGKTTLESVLGLSFLSSICGVDNLNFGYSANSILSFQTIITAHEIGHSLSATHPEDTLSNPPTSLMTGVISSEQNNFSEFSKNEINTFSSNNSCLNNKVFKSQILKRTIISKKGKKYLKFFIQDINLNNKSNTLRIYLNGTLYYYKKTSRNYISETINLKSKSRINDYRFLFE